MTRLNFITIVKFNEFTIYVCAPHKVWVNRITQNIYRGRGKCCDGTDALSGNRMRKALWFIILNESECVWGEWKTEEKRPPHSSGDCVILNRAKKKVQRWLLWWTKTINFGWSSSRAAEKKEKNNWTHNWFLLLP